MAKNSERSPEDALRPLDTTRFRVDPGEDAGLADRDPRDTGTYDGDKKDGIDVHEDLNEELEQLQELLYADGRHKLLVVLQALDAGGKDGSIRHVFEHVNPQGVKIASFKKPTDEELAHDYLWRVHKHTPASGEIAIFNRSHYEDVLVVRVHSLVPEEQWSRRFGHINDFERRLADEGTTIRKFFLHTSKDEQRERLQARLDEPDKNWKFDTNDLKEREHWDEYQLAYEDMLTKTSTSWAPWYVVPADRKWFRNIVISQVIVETLQSLELRHPDPAPGLADITVV